MNTIYIVDLESVPTRYTVQWKSGLPEYMQKYIQSKNRKFDVVNISGGEVEMIATPGAFLNFAGTNVYKSNQAIEISKLISEGKVKNGDKFLFTDAWNPVIPMVRYMVELLGIKAELHGIWHAGSYDPQDFLGRLIEDKRWSLTFEASVYHALDYSYFATKFHINMFKKNVLQKVGFGLNEEECYRKMVLSGQPHDKLLEHLQPFKGMQKRDLILFPHRVAPEKQPEIFRDLATYLPEYEFVVCQDQQLSKDEYHTLLGESKMVFSANLQETLGISAMEAIAVDSIALVPDRLSYSEMYYDFYKYPSEWTETWASYEANRDKLIDIIRRKMNDHQFTYGGLGMQREKLEKQYLNAEVMFGYLTRQVA